MLLNFIYPPVCGICGKINKKRLCTKCKNRLKKYEIDEIVDFRSDSTKHFDYQIKPFLYKDIIRTKILDYKFNEHAYLYETFEKMILNNNVILIEIGAKENTMEEVMNTVEALSNIIIKYIKG